MSNMYLMVVAAVLSTYYLPRLSEVSEKSDLRAEIKQGYRVIMPVVIFMSIAIFTLKDFLIWMLFTDDFTQMRDLFLWQLVGDVAKLASWLLSYLMLAKCMMRLFLTTEIIFNISFALLSIWFVELYGLIGTSYAFAVNYILYLIVVFLTTRRIYI